MLTKFGKKIAELYASYALGSYYIVPFVSITSNEKAIIECKNAGGSTKYTNGYLASSSNSIINSELIVSGSGSTNGVVLGSGNTPPSEDDYTIENQITGFTSSSVVTSVGVDTENDTITYNWDYTITNNTGADITIREIAKFASVNSTDTKGDNASTSSTYKMSVMLDRTVLDQPVTIPNGEARVVRYKRTINI